MTLDAVGGVWRYAIDVARGLDAFGVKFLLVGFGPQPDAAQQAECASLTNAELHWTNEPLDWMVTQATDLLAGSEQLAALGLKWNADLLHLNLPSQASGLKSNCPVVVASHSCVPTWWEAVRGTQLPAIWAWQQNQNRDGLQRADAVLVPSHSHGAALCRIYGQLPCLHVVHNATAISPAPAHSKKPLVLAVGRWWDEGKNGAVLDAANLPQSWQLILAGPLRGPNGQQARFQYARTPGPLAHPDILRLMNQASIFAAPSRYEPFGLAVVEAAISGAALVLADIPTFRELWNGAALFVSPDNPEGWQQTFANLIDNEPRRQALARKAAERAGRFTLRRQAEQLHELYASLEIGALT